LPYVSLEAAGTRQHSTESDPQVDDKNVETSPNTTLEPRPWRERYRWLGILMVAAFAGMAPAPPPKPLRDLTEYSQIAEDPEGLKVDPELHFVQKEVSR